MNKLGIEKVRNFMLPSPNFLPSTFFFLSKTLEKKICNLRKWNLEVVCIKFDVCRGQSYRVEKRKKWLPSYLEEVYRFSAKLSHNFFLKVIFKILHFAFLNLTEQQRIEV